MSKSNGFTLYFSNSDTTPDCSKSATITPLVSAERDEILLYPNPFTQEITLQVNGNEDISSVEIYNQLGKQVLYIDGSSIQNNIKSFGNNLEPGIYLVKIIGGTVNTYKVVKE